MRALFRWIRQGRYFRERATPSESFESSVQNGFGSREAYTSRPNPASLQCVGGMTAYIYATARSDRIPPRKRPSQTAWVAD